jgi:hypothetical protein
VYVPLRNAYVEDWVMRGRNRSGHVQSVQRNDGAQPLLTIASRRHAIALFA